MYPEEFHSLVCLVYGESHERKINYNKSTWELTEKGESPSGEMEWLGRFTKEGPLYTTLKI